MANWGDLRSSARQSEAWVLRDLKCKRGMKFDLEVCTRQQLALEWRALGHLTQRTSTTNLCGFLEAEVQWSLTRGRVQDQFSLRRPQPE